MNEFEEKKQKRERGVSVKEVLDSVEELDDVESVVIVAKRKGGEVETYYSWDSSLEALGMLSVGKTDVLNSMKY